MTNQRCYLQRRYPGMLSPSKIIPRISRVEVAVPASARRGSGGVRGRCGPAPMSLTMPR